MLKQSASIFPITYEVLGTRRAPDKFVVWGKFIREGDALVFKEQIKYDMASTKIKKIDRRI